MTQERGGKRGKSDTLLEDVLRRKRGDKTLKEEGLARRGTGGIT